MKPLFILCLPRSGSTLLQRLINVHPKVSTAPEPWFLLPLLHPLASDGAGAEYSYSTFRIAQQEMLKRLPNGQADYFLAVKNAAIHIYSQLSDPDAVYFLDKTPRYHLISEQLLRTFPDAKFILLWRNPLAVAASMLEFRPPWNLYDWYVDLFLGFENLYAFSQAHQDKVLNVRYEDIIKDTENAASQIFRYLGLDALGLDLLPDQQPQDSVLGDKTGFEKYQNRIGTGSLDHWTSVMRNPFRRIWALHYLRFIGEERLSFLGYDQKVIKLSLISYPITLKDLHVDLFKWIYGFFHNLLNISLVREKIKKMRQGKRVYPYS